MVHKQYHGNIFKYWGVYVQNRIKSGTHLSYIFFHKKPYSNTNTIYMRKFAHLNSSDDTGA
jgi:hypothetical protein